MCGIVGYIGPQDATPIILAGLKRLEYRGYDSAGLAVIQDSEIVVRRDVGKLARLSALIQEAPVSGHVGIGHTRWATHGEPSTRNAHPHMGMTGNVVVVHNGIVENYLELRDELLKEGAVFNSETDTEVLPHLIEKYYRGNLEEAVRRALQDVEGSYAVAVIHRNSGELIAARNESPLLIGLGDGEKFLASDAPALVDYSDRVVYLEDGDLVLTSGLGGGYPTDLIIGQVTNIRKREADLFQQASVQPVVDFSRLSIVLVITNFRPVNIEPLIPAVTP